MKRWWIAAVAVLAVLGIAWLWGSPYLTLSALKRAADARDFATLSDHVDYPRVRASLHGQLDAELAKKARNDDPLAGLGRALARRLSDPIIDAVVTPEGMQAVFASAPTTQPSEPEPVKLRAKDMQLHREGITRFRLQQSDGAGTQLVFALEGLSWRLVEVRLPSGGLRL
jgi:hypothetical protein